VRGPAADPPLHERQRQSVLIYNPARQLIDTANQSTIETANVTTIFAAIKTTLYSAHEATNKTTFISTFK
jgi:hypothetical protein